MLSSEVRDTEGIQLTVFRWCASGCAFHICSTIELESEIQLKSNKNNAMFTLILAMGPLLSI